MTLHKREVANEIIYTGWEGRTGPDSAGQGCRLCRGQRRAGQRHPYRVGQGRTVPGGTKKGRSVAQGWVEPDKTWHGQQNRTVAENSVRQCRARQDRVVPSWVGQGQAGLSMAEYGKNEQQICARSGMDGHCRAGPNRTASGRV